MAADSLYDRWVIAFQDFIPSIIAARSPQEALRWQKYSGSDLIRVKPRSLASIRTVPQLCDALVRYDRLRWNTSKISTDLISPIIMSLTCNVISTRCRLSNITKAEYVLSSYCIRTYTARAVLCYVIFWLQAFCPSDTLLTTKIKLLESDFGNVK